jgi:Protein of unknown function (DUF2934)
MARAAQRETLSQNEQNDASESQTPQTDSGANPVAQTESGSNRVPQTDSGSEHGDSQDASFDLAVSDDERRRMIAEAAYFIALRRDFDGGLELEDWLAAEAEVNAELGRRSAQ